MQSLTNADLIDEYRILVHPVVVGEGGHLFDNIVGRKDLKLLSTQTFEHGAMLVCYELVKSFRQYAGYFSYLTALRTIGSPLVRPLSRFRRHCSFLLLANPRFSYGSTP